jgi:hypothetical protein
LCRHGAGVACRQLGQGEGLSLLPISRCVWNARLLSATDAGSDCCQLRTARVREPFGGAERPGIEGGD